MVDEPAQRLVATATVSFRQSLRTGLVHPRFAIPADTRSNVRYTRVVGAVNEKFRERDEDPNTHDVRASAPPGEF